MSMNPFMYVCMHVCIHLSVCLPICLSVYLSVYRACIYLSVSIYCTSIYPPTCVSIHNMCLSVCVCLYLRNYHNLSIHPSVCLNTNLSIKWICQLCPQARKLLKMKCSFLSLRASEASLPQGPGTSPAWALFIADELPGLMSVLSSWCGSTPKALKTF